MSILDFLHSWVLAIAGISKPNGRGNAVSIAITDVLLVNWPQIIRDRPKVSRKPGFPLRRRVKSSNAQTWKPDEQQKWGWEGFTCCWSASSPWRPPWSPARRRSQPTGEWMKFPALPGLSQLWFGKNCWRRRKMEGTLFNHQLRGCWKRGQGFSMDFTGDRARWQNSYWIQETMEWKVISSLIPGRDKGIVYKQMQYLFGKNISKCNNVYLYM